MPPQPGVTSPTRRFCITSLDVSTGVETNVAVSTLLPSNFTTDGSVRPTVMTQVRDLRTANPGIVYILYSPPNSGYYMNGDRVWDSRVSD